MLYIITVKTKATPSNPKAEVYGVITTASTRGDIDPLNIIHSLENQPVPERTKKRETATLKLCLKQHPTRKHPFYSCITGYLTITHSDDVSTEHYSLEIQ